MHPAYSSWRIPHRNPWQQTKAFIQNKSPKNPLAVTLSMVHTGVSRKSTNDVPRETQNQIDSISPFLHHFWQLFYLETWNHFSFPNISTFKNNWTNDLAQAIKIYYSCLEGTRSECWWFCIGLSKTRLTYRIIGWLSQPIRWIIVIVNPPATWSEEWNCNVDSYFHQEVWIESIAVKEDSRSLTEKRKIHITAWFFKQDSPMWVMKSIIDTKLNLLWV